MSHQFLITRINKPKLNKHTRIRPGVLKKFGDHGGVQRSRGIVQDNCLWLLHGKDTEYGVSVTRIALFLAQAPLVTVTAQQDWNTSQFSSVDKKTMIMRIRTLMWPYITFCSSRSQMFECIMWAGVVRDTSLSEVYWWWHLFILLLQKYVKIYFWRAFFKIVSSFLHFRGKLQFIWFEKKKKSF